MPTQYARSAKHVYASGTAISEKIPADDVLNELIKGYFGYDIYLTGGVGYKSPREFMDEDKLSVQKAIDAAIENNRMRIANEKNVFFSGDENLRKKLMSTYEAIAAGTYNPVELATLQTVIRCKRRCTEVTERVNMRLDLNPSADRDVLEKEVQNEVDEGEAVDLQSEAQWAQKAQISRSVNAKALELALDEDMEVYGAKMKMKVVGAYLADNLLSISMEDLEKPIRSTVLKNYLTALPENQRTPYLELVRTQAKKIRAAFLSMKQQLPEQQTNTLTLQKQLLDVLLAPEAIDLTELNASYTGSADKNSSQEEADQVLQQIDVGLIMHLASDSKFAVGTTMKNVLSTQQAIISDNDELNDVLLVCQLHGRSIRDKEATALYQQVMAEGVKSYFKLSDVIALDLYEG